MIYAKDKEQAYRTVPEGTYYYGLTLIDGDIYRVLMWNDLLSIEGTDTIVKMTFRLFDVTIKGSGLIQLIRDAKRHRIGFQQAVEQMILPDPVDPQIGAGVALPGKSRPFQ